MVRLLNLTQEQFSNLMFLVVMVSFALMAAHSFYEKRGDKRKAALFDTILHYYFWVGAPIILVIQLNVKR